MAWDSRGYYYRSRKVRGKVLRDYYGTGPIAETAAACMAELRQKREARAREADGLLAELAAAEAAFRAYEARAELIAAAHLIAAGVRRYPTRRWRKGRVKSDRPQAS